MQIGFPSTSLAVPGALGPFPAARLYADNLAYPTTTDVLAWAMLNDGATGDTARSAPVAGTAQTAGVQAVGAYMYDSPASSHTQFRSARSLGAADPGSAIGVTHPFLYNGASYDPQTNNRAGTLLASAVRTATVQTAVQTNYNARGIIVQLNITDAPNTAETLSMELFYRDAVAAFDGNYPVSFTGPAGSSILAVQTTLMFIIYPGASEAALASPTRNYARGIPVPRSWAILVRPSAASNWTYSLAFSTIL